MKTSCYVIISAAILTFFGCSNTVVTGSWADPHYSGQIKNVFIVGVTRNDANRRIFEDQFAKKLQGAGIKAHVSYDDLPDLKVANKKMISQKISTYNADSVLITRILGRQAKEEFFPGILHRSKYSPDSYSSRWDTFYDRSFDVLYEPPSVMAYELITLESNLYDSKTGDLIWAAQLETVKDEKIARTITDFITSVSNDLKEKGIL